MYIPEKYPDKINIYRGTQHRLYLEIVENSTKLPVDYTGSTFTAILIDQQDRDYEILATYSIGSFSCISSCYATLDFILDENTTASISEDYVYLRIFHDDNLGRRNLFLYGNVEIKV